MIKIQDIPFPDQTAKCAFFEAQDDLVAALSALGLDSGQPVISLIGGFIYKEHLEITRQAVQAVATAAQEVGATIIAGGSKMGVMALIGMARAENGYNFPILGVNIYDLVTYPGGPKSTKFLWWGKQRWQLSPHYTHYLLVRGEKYGHESPTLSQTASILSTGNRSLSVLMNGGVVSRIDVDLSLKANRPVITVAGTGRYADELAENNTHPDLISVVSGDDGEALKATIIDQLQ